MTCNGDDKDWSPRWKECFLHELTARPKHMTEVRRDGKDDAVIAKVIATEMDRRLGLDERKKSGIRPPSAIGFYKSDGKVKFEAGMRDYAAACWQTCEQLHMLMLDDEQPENEKQKMDPDHWYEINLTNALLFANLSLEGLPQLVPGRLFSTRMPRNIVEDEGERRDFIDKCRKNDLRVICVLTEPEEFEKYSGESGLLDFYRDECGLTVYNRAIPDFQIPIHGDLVNNIIDLTYHLSQGRNRLVHCAGGTGRTGMVIAAVVKNLGFYDVISRIRKVKSTYVETPDQELFLKNVPKTIDKRIVREKPMLACAIAAEQLIQLFHTHKSAIAKQESKDKKNAYLDSIEDSLDVLDLNDEDGLREAYGQTFDMIDQDRSGNLDRKEITDWFEMCGAEIDTSKLIDTMMSDGYLTRDKFIKFMTALAKTHHRDYDLSGSLGGGHD